MDLSQEALDRRIESLRPAYSAYGARLRERNRVYLRAYSPPFDANVAEHDQWPERIKAGEAGHTRSSYNITRSVVDLWTALEGSVFPAVRWWEAFIPTPVPSLDENENARVQTVYRARKLVARQTATLREQELRKHIRRTRLPRHYYRAVRRKNLYGHSWLRCWPDPATRSFKVESDIDNSTVYPVWSSSDDSKLDAVVVAYRRSARQLDAQYPGILKLDDSGRYVDDGSYYVPTAEYQTEVDRAFVWCEDYWILEETYDSDGNVTDSRVGNLLRINGKAARHRIIPGWKRVPYFYFENEDERDRLGFSDVASMLPIQDGFNRMLSQQQDVIFGESRPKFKYRGDADRTIDLRAEEVVSLDQDEDIDQIRVSLDVFPTQVHGTQLTQVMQRVTGLPAVAWGEIQAASNSGRALSTAWRATAARLAPRLDRIGQSLDELFGTWIDWMVLYGWDGADTLYGNDRDFEFDFPNQEPRDFTEVTLEAINRMNAGIIDLQGAMEATGEQSPDEMIERVRASYMDTVLHPEKAQSFLLLTRLRNQIEIEAQQAGIQAQAAQAQMAQMGANAPGNAPVTPEQQQAMAQSATQQQASTAAPALAAQQNQPASVPGGPPGAGGSTRKVSTMVQDGSAMNRIVDQGTMQ